MYLASAEKETLEKRARAVHRLYLEALMRLDALEDEDRPLAGVSESELSTARAEHTLQFNRLNRLLVQLGYVPRGLTTRDAIQREYAAKTTGPHGRGPDRMARAAARAEMPVR